MGASYRSYSTTRASLLSVRAAYICATGGECHYGLSGARGRSAKLTSQAPESLQIFEARHDEMKESRCMSFTSKGTSEILVAGEQDKMFVIDTVKGEVTKQVRLSKPWLLGSQAQYG